MTDSMIEKVDALLAVLNEIASHLGSLAGTLSEIEANQHVHEEDE